MVIKLKKLSFRGAPLRVRPKRRGTRNYKGPWQLPETTPTHGPRVGAVTGHLLVFLFDLLEYMHILATFLFLPPKTGPSGHLEFGIVLDSGFFSEHWTGIWWSDVTFVPNPHRNGLVAFQNSEPGF